MLNNLLWNIKYELNELRYSTALPIAVIAWAIVVFDVVVIVKAVI